MSRDGRAKRVFYILQKEVLDNVNGLLKHEVLLDIYLAYSLPVMSTVSGGNL